MAEIPIWADYNTLRRQSVWWKEKMVEATKLRP
jgi:hypothetical protein